MKRPMLISGITATAIMALLTLIPKSAAVLVILSASVLVFSLILKRRGRDTLLASFVCIATIISVLCFSAYTSAKITPANRYTGMASKLKCSMENRIELTAPPQATPLPSNSAHRMPRKMTSSHTAGSTAYASTKYATPMVVPS